MRLLRKRETTLVFLHHLLPPIILIPQDFEKEFKTKTKFLGKKDLKKIGL
jgi:hypothetical protein